MEIPFPPSAHWLPAPLTTLPEWQAWLARDPARAHCVKQHRKRSVWALAPASGQAPTVYLKHDHPHTWRDRAKATLGPRCRREYLALRGLANLGLPVPTPLGCAWAGTDGVLLMAAVPAAHGADDWWRQHALDNPARAAFLRELAALFRRLLAAEVFLPDLHFGNLLVQDTPAGPHLVLVDAYGARRSGGWPGTPQSPPPAPTPGSTNRRLLLATLGLLWWERARWTLAERQELLRQCVGEAAAESVWAQLAAFGQADEARRWRGRRWKLLGPSSFAERHRNEHGVWRLRPGVPLAQAVAAVAAHRQQVAEAPSRLLKNDTKRRVSRVPWGTGEAVVKEFRRPGPWGIFAADCRAWWANWRLTLAGYPVPTCQAWLRAPDGHAYLVMDFQPGELLLAAWQAAAQDPPRLTALIDAALQVLAKLHEGGIVHADFKPNNLIVVPGTEPPRLVLIDNDHVLFGQRINQAALDRNFRHLSQGLGQWPALTTLLTARYALSFPHWRPRPVARTPAG